VIFNIRNGAKSGKKHSLEFLEYYGI
jgi:hypothetical protein